MPNILSSKTSLVPRLRTGPSKTTLKGLKWWSFSFWIIGLFYGGFWEFFIGSYAWFYMSKRLYNGVLCPIVNLYLEARARSFITDWNAKPCRVLILLPKFDLFYYLLLSNSKHGKCSKVVVLVNSFFFAFGSNFYIPNFSKTVISLVFLGCKAAANPNGLSLIYEDPCCYYCSSFPSSSSIFTAEPKGFINS